MSRPTINEMLAYLDNLPGYIKDKTYLDPIRVILQQEQMRQERDARPHQEQFPPEIKWADYIKAGGR